MYCRQILPVALQFVAGGPAVSCRWLLTNCHFVQVGRSDPAEKAGTNRSFSDRFSKYGESA